ncbi:snRNA-activating protein complex subunit 1b isoform X1 [Polypterus senegalus]
MDVNLEHALKNDCKTLLSRFQQTESVRYEEFSAIWRDMKFSTIFYGKMHPTEMRSFTKEVLSIGTYYFFPPYSFQIRVGGLYLLYGLYHSQLCDPKEKIRIALKDWEEVVKFQHDIVNAQHYDTAYILKKMFSAKAFYFTAMPRLLYYRTKQKVNKHAVCEDFRERTWKINSLVTEDSLEEILNVHEHYQKMKCAISRDKTQPDRILRLLTEDFPQELQNTVSSFNRWLDEQKKKSTEKRPRGKLEDDGECEDMSRETEASARARMLANIKSRSFSNVAEASKSRRHRQTELGSSESGSDHGVQRKSSTKRKSLAGRTKLAENKSGVKQEVGMETAGQRFSMPVISEESDEERAVNRPTKKKRFS